MQRQRCIDASDAGLITCCNSILEQLYCFHQKVVFSSESSVGATLTLTLSVNMPLSRSSVYTVDEFHVMDIARSQFDKK